jgi:hypothetical protein
MTIGKLAATAVTVGALLASGGVTGTALGHGLPMAQNPEVGALLVVTLVLGALLRGGSGSAKGVRP